MRELGRGDGSAGKESGHLESSENFGGRGGLSAFSARVEHRQGISGPGSLATLAHKGTSGLSERKTVPQYIRWSTIE